MLEELIGLLLGKWIVYNCRMEEFMLYDKLRFLVKKKNIYSVYVLILIIDKYFNYSISVFLIVWIVIFCRRY